MSQEALHRRDVLAATALAALMSGIDARADAAEANTWRDRSKNADQRAASLVAAMTLDEKISLLQSHFFLPPSMAAMAAALPNHTHIDRPADALGVAGYTLGVPRLSIPSLNESDASAGVARGMEMSGRSATAFPATILTASTWNPELSHACGAGIGEEARASGISVMLAGGVNLTRDPRCGRTFEYYGEDPLLAGQMAGAAVAGIQSQRVISTVKHFALNAQETGRNYIDETIDPAALRESDLLAFEIAIEIGAPGSVMNAYNKINGTYCSENAWLLSDVLKRDWRYPGYVMGDWGSSHSTREAALAGLDQQSGQEVDVLPYFGGPLKQLAQSDRAIAVKVDEKVHRILRSVIAIGVFDDPPHPGGDLKLSVHAESAQRAAEEGIVLLKNTNSLLPLSPSVRSIALIGLHADVGVLSGGGSAQVQPPGSIISPAPNLPIPGMGPVDHPSSPLRALKAAAPNANVQFIDGTDHAAAAALAAHADVAIVIARRWDSEGMDARDLSLPNEQDALIAAVAAANPRTIVAITAGGPIVMPWLDHVGAVLMAWYPGIRGAEALAAMLFGAVNPSGRLPVTFPRSTDDLPRPQIAGIGMNFPMMPGMGNPPPADFNAHMNEGADVGYRWHEKRNNAVLFPFGFGLSYTTFSISDVTVENARDLQITCSVANTGQRAGKQVVQVYARPPQSGAARRLVGFAKVALAPGETKHVAIKAEPRLLARFDTQANAWRIDAGDYEIAVGTSATDLQTPQRVRLPAKRLRA